MKAAVTASSRVPLTRTTPEAFWCRYRLRDRDRFQGNGLSCNRKGHSIDIVNLRVTRYRKIDALVLQAEVWINDLYDVLSVLKPIGRMRGT